MCAHFQSPNQEALRRLNPHWLQAGAMSGLPAGWKTDIWPGKPAPVLTNETGATWQLASFGLMPHWAKPTLYRNTYNARSETAASKPSFRVAWRNAQLCAIPVAEFYEPNYESGKAQPWAIGRASGEPFWLAGLWECFEDTFGQPIRTFTLLTIAAEHHAMMSRFHGPEDEKRSVVVVPEDRLGDWLKASSTPEIRGFLSLFDANDFTCSPA